MATVKGVNRTLADTPTEDNILDAGVLGGNIKVMQDTYEASALAAADIIKIGKKLPVGARIQEVILAWDALGASTTLIVGDQGDDNRYITSQDSSSAGVARLNVADGMEYEVTAIDTDDEIQVTLGGAAGTGTIKATVLYTYE